MEFGTLLRIVDLIVIVFILSLPIVIFIQGRKPYFGDFAPPSPTHPPFSHPNIMK